MCNPYIILNQYAALTQRRPSWRGAVVVTIRVRVRASYREDLVGPVGVVGICV